MLIIEVSSTSDVHSFGVVLWEIMTFGGNPYSDIHTIDQMKAALTNGKLLIKPQLASTTLYNLMKMCWNLAHRDRPTFIQCLDDLQNMTNDFFSGSLNQLVEYTQHVSRQNKFVKDEIVLEPNRAPSVESLAPDPVEITRV